MSDVKDVFNVYYPTYILARYTGFFGYRIEGPPKRRVLKPFKRYNILTNAFQFIAILAIVWPHFGVFVQYEVPYIIMYFALYSIVMMRCIHFIIAVIRRNVYNHELIKILKELNRLDLEFEGYGIELPYARLKICFFVFVIFLTVDASYDIFIIYNTLVEKKTRLLEYVWEFCRVYLNLTQTIFIVSFFSIVLIIESMFSNLNQCLANRFSINKEIIHLTGAEISCLRDMMQYYHRLICILIKYIRIVSPQILMVVGIHFCYGATQSLIFVQDFARDGLNWEFVRRLAAVSGMAVLKLRVLIGTSNGCQKEVRL